MKKVFLFCGALLVMTAAIANAQSRLHLSVGDCGGASTLSWTCTSNGGAAFTVIASATVPAGVVTLVAEESVVEIGFEVPVPDWWKLGGGCRAANALAVGYNGGLYSCIDYFGGVSTVLGVNSYQIGPDPGVGDPNGPIDDKRVRMRFVSAVDYDLALLTPPPAMGDEIFLYSLVMNKTKSAGVGACAGCNAKVAMVLRNVKLNQPSGTPGGDPVMGLPDVNDVGYTCFNGSIDPTCPLSTPATRSSWGQIKSLYR